MDRALAEDSHKVAVVHMAEGIRDVGVERITAVDIALHAGDMQVLRLVYYPDLV